MINLKYPRIILELNTIDKSNIQITNIIDNKLNLNSAYIDELFGLFESNGVVFNDIDKGYTYNNIEIHAYNADTAHNPTDKDGLMMSGIVKLCNQTIVREVFLDKQFINKNIASKLW